MKWIPKYQKTGKLNFKTTGLPWQQSKQDQEITRNTQSRGILNPTNLKNRLQPAAKNLKAKYNNLSVRERLALAKKSMPHSEIVTVKDQQENTKTSTNPQVGAMSGADPVGEFVQELLQEIQDQVQVKWVFLKWVRIQFHIGLEIVYLMKLLEI